METAGGELRSEVVLLEGGSMVERGLLLANVESGSDSFGGLLLLVSEPPKPAQIALAML